MPDDPHIPDRLRDDLRRLHAARVPEEADDRILDAASEELRRGSVFRRLRRHRLVLAGSGVAAALALGVTIFLLQAGRQSAGPLPTGGARGPLAAEEPAPADREMAMSLPEAQTDAADLNGDGVVDILDAHAMALAIERDATDATPDDLRDLVRRIVSLGSAS